MTRLGLASRWREWTGSSGSRQILGSALVVVAGTIIVKIAAVAKEVAVAAEFGTGDSLDAFLIAFVVPAFAINVIAGSFAAAVMPVYVSVRENSPEEAEALMGRATVTGIILLTIVAAAIGAVARPLLPVIASGFGPEKVDTTRRLLLLLLPAIVLGGATLMIQVALHAEERFAGAAVAPVCVPLVTLAAVLTLATRIGVGALVIGVVVGYSLQVLVLLLLVRRSGLWSWSAGNRMSRHMRVIGRQYLPMVGGAFLMSGTAIIDQAMAAMLPGGNVSALVYGERFVNVTVGLGTMALGTAALPHFSTMVARGQWERISSTLRSWTWHIAWGSFAGLLVLVPLSEPLVRLVFEHGVFSAADTRVVGRVQALYLLQLPFHVAAIMYVRLVSSLQANRFLLLGAAISLVLNIGFNLLFMRWLGVAGIALSTSVVYLVSFSYLLFVLKHQLARARVGQGFASNSDG